MKNKEKYDLTALSFNIQNACVELIDNTNNQVVFKVKSYNYVQIIIELLKWLEQEYIEPTKLTDDEIVILKNIDKTYKWVARDSSNIPYVYKDKPIKDEYRWCGNFISLMVLEHLFKFIKWEDEEPYNIDELLKINGAKRG